MKNSKKIDNIHVITKKPPRKDIEVIAKDLLSNELQDSEVVSLGENRKQYFIRLPTRLTDRLKLSKTDKIKVVWTGSESKIKIDLEVVHDS